MEDGKMEDRKMGISWLSKEHFSVINLFVILPSGSVFLQRSSGWSVTLAFLRGSRDVS